MKNYIPLRKKLKTKVLLNQPNGSTVVQLYGTPIVTFNAHTVEFFHAGWASITTKRRMNQACREFDLDFSIVQKNHQWRVIKPNGHYEIFRGRRVKIKRNH